MLQAAEEAGGEGEAAAEATVAAEEVVGSSTRIILLGIELDGSHRSQSSQRIAFMHIIKWPCNMLLHGRTNK